MLTIYLAGPITGLEYNQATQWREAITNNFRPLGYRVINPMEGENDTLNEQSPVLSDRVKEIVHLDKYYVDQSDIVFVNFEHYAEDCSVGTVSELAWAWSNRSLIIAVVPEGCPYDRKWLDVLYTFKVRTFEDGIEILKGIQ